MFADLCFHCARHCEEQAPQQVCRTRREYFLNHSSLAFKILNHSWSPKNGFRNENDFNDNNKPNKEHTDISTDATYMFWTPIKRVSLVAFTHKLS